MGVYSRWAYFREGTVNVKKIHKKLYLIKEMYAAYATRQHNYRQDLHRQNIIIMAAVLPRGHVQTKF